MSVTAPRGFRAAGAAGTPKIVDFWPAPKPSIINTIAPAIDIGTETRTIKGSRKLSNKAARARKTIINANPKV